MINWRLVSSLVLVLWLVAGPVWGQNKYTAAFNPSTSPICQLQTIDAVEQWVCTLKSSETHIVTETMTFNATYGANVPLRLVFQCGTTVQVVADAKLTLAPKSLVLVGCPNSPITFTKVANGGGWEGLRIDPTATLDGNGTKDVGLRHLRVEHAKIGLTLAGLRASDGSPLPIRDVVISNWTTTGLFLFDIANVELANVALQSGGSPSPSCTGLNVGSKAQALVSGDLTIAGSCSSQSTQFAVGIQLTGTLTSTPAGRVKIASLAGVSVQGVRVEPGATFKAAVEISDLDALTTASGVHVMGGNVELSGSVANLAGTSVTGITVVGVDSALLQNLQITGPSWGVGVRLVGSASITSVALTNVAFDGLGSAVVVSSSVVIGTLAMRRLSVKGWTTQAIKVSSEVKSLFLENSQILQPTQPNGIAVVLKGGVLRFNTIVGGNDARFGIALTDSNTASIVVGNLLSGFNTAGLQYANVAGTQMVANNVFDAPCAYLAGNNCVATPSGNFNVDPRFRDPDNGDFGLSFNSPSELFNTVAKVDAPGIDVDLLGNPRIGKVDIGAIERPLVVSVAPAFLRRGDTGKSLELMGYNFDNSGSGMRFNIRDAGGLDANVTPNQFDVTTGTNSKVTLSGITVNDAAALGTRGLLVINNNVGATSRTLSTGLLTITDKLTLKSSGALEPSCGEANKVMTVLVNGTGLDYEPTVSFDDPAIIVKYTMVLSRKQLKIELVIGSEATLGPKTLTVTGGDGVKVQLPGAFEIKANCSNAAPTVIDPPSSVTCVFDAPCNLELQVNDSEGDTLSFELDDFGPGSTPLSATQQGGVYTLTFKAPELAPEPPQLVFLVKDGTNTVQLTVGFTGTTNSAPSAVTLLKPAKNGEGVRLSVNGKLTFKNALDTTPVAGKPTTYRCLVSETVDFANTVASVDVAETADKTSCTATGLKEDTFYFVKIISIDGYDAKLTSESKVYQIFYSATNDNPTVPVLVRPSDTSTVALTSEPIELRWRNAKDPEGEALVYEIVIAKTDQFAEPDIVQTYHDVAENAGLRTSFFVEAKLQLGTYYWRVRAQDPSGNFGDWSKVFSFTLADTNVAPPVPQLVMPADEASLSEVQPTLVVNNVTDPDGDTVSYVFKVDVIPYDDDATVDTQYAEVPAGTLGTTEWTVVSPLNKDVTYYWKVRAKDDKGHLSDWSEPRSFRIPGANQAPPVPTPVSPIADATVDQLSGIPFVFAKVSDPDGDSVSYTLEIYSADASDPNKPDLLIDLVEGIPTSDTANKTFVYGGTLLEGKYFWRVRAVDAKGATSDWSGHQAFVVALPAPEPDASDDVGDPDTSVADGSLDAETSPDTNEPEVDALTPPDSSVDDVSDDTGTPDDGTGTPGDDSGTPGDDIGLPDGGSDLAGVDGSNAGGDTAGLDAGQNDTSIDGDTGATSKKKGGGCTQSPTSEGAPLFVILLLIAAVARRRRWLGDRC